MINTENSLNNNDNNDIILVYNEDDEYNLNNQADDLESQNKKFNLIEDSLKLSIKNQVPLKGILKRPEDNNFTEEMARFRLMKFCLILFVLIYLTPMSFTDLYYGFKEDNCLRYHPNNLSVSMKLYLLVSGFISFGIMLIMIFYICLLPNKESYYKSISFPFIILFILYL